VWVHDYHIVAEVLKAWGHGREKRKSVYMYFTLDIWGTACT